jgi:hypothetical protein
MVVKANEKLISALEKRILNQKNQHIDLSKMLMGGSRPFLI